ncbi:MAG: exodeoxyribonuclease VII small subunit [Flavobacteriales bacterium]|nr:exodeoxyribonuclease VII small subunit [Flavobacteriales bacterium]
MNEELNYSQAFQELQKLVSEIEDGQISVDDLSAKVKRAAFLIKICQAKLSATEEDVHTILKELQDSTEGAPDDDEVDPEEQFNDR